MRLKYFIDTNTLHVELSKSKIVETRELTENLYIDLDADGKVVSFTIEHAKELSGKFDFFYETVTG